VIPDELRDHRILSVGQLTRAGVTPVDTRQALAAGELTRLKRGWYTPRTMEWPTDRHALVVQAELKDHPGTVPSHQSGAILLGYPVHRPDLKRVHLMRVDDGPARSRPTVVIHRRVDDAAVLLPALVIAQTALTCPVSGLMAIDHALRTGSVTLADVESWCSRLKDHVGRAHLVPVLALADGRRESPLESHSALTFHHWGWRLHPQFEVPGTQYRADARLGASRVLIECDGTGKYDEQGSEMREKLREDEIRSLGWEVVRITTELLTERTKLIRRVNAALSRAQRRAA
jgi:very-short-patch-repair endonuclease